MSWLCSCGVLNSGANEDCAASKQTQFEWARTQHNQISVNSPDFIVVACAAAEIWRVGEISMTEQEELFAKYWNHEKVLVKDMDLVQLREHIEELQKIAFEAKARVSSAVDEQKERKAKTSNKEWLVTDTKPDVNVSDAINAVKQRAARMSKMDKMREDLKKAGLDDDTIKEMIGHLERKATDSKLKTVTFSKPTTEIAAVQVKPAPKEPAAPFDASALKFGN